MSSSRPSKGGAEPAVVLIAGSEATLRDAALAEIRERVLAGAVRDFDEDHFDLAASGVDATAIASALRTLPVLAPRRLVRVRGLEDRRAAKFLERVLLEYLEEPQPTTCLVLEVRSLDRRLKWVKRVAKIGELRDCSPPERPQDVRGWIEGRLRATGKRIEGGVASALYERVGADLDRLASEIDKIVLYVGDGDAIGPDDVSEITGQSRDRAIYELTDAMGNRRLPEALAVLAVLLGQGEVPLRLLAALANHYRRLLRASECVPLEAAEVERRLSISFFAAQKLVEQVRRFDRARLLRCLNAVRRTDAALKGGTTLTPELAIEQLVFAVCS